MKMKAWRQGPTGLRVALLGLALGLPMLAGCRKENPSAEPARQPDPAKQGLVVLDVEGTLYTNADFEAHVGRITGNAERDRLSPPSLSRLFDSFVDEKILLASARRQSVSVTDEEIRNFQAKLEGESLSPEAASDALLVEKYATQTIRVVAAEDGEVASYYEEHKKDFLLPERVRVSQILLDSENKAVDVLRRLENAGEEEFRKIAREESRGPEASKGGEMGVFKAGDLPPEMEKVVFTLEEGSVSQVLESSYGFHIFRIDKKYPPQLLEEAEAAPSIRAKILDRKFKEALAVHLDGLKKTMTWNSYPDNLDFPYQRNDS